MSVAPPFNGGAPYHPLSGYSNFCQLLSRSAITYREVHQLEESIPFQSSANKACSIGVRCDMLSAPTDKKTLLFCGALRYKLLIAYQAFGGSRRMDGPGTHYQFPGTCSPSQRLKFGRNRYLFCARHSKSYLLYIWGFTAIEQV